MRLTSFAALTAVVALAACTPSDAGRVAAPRLTAAHVPDFTGAPDLIVDGKALEGSWVVYDQILKEGTCTLEEGGVIDPTVSHRVVRFTVNTPNIGDADIALGDPAVHVAAGDGLYQLSTCHQHWHFQHYATYELVDPATGKVWQAAKRGFCMIDVVPWNGGVQAPSSWVYHVCGRPAGSLGPAIVGNQGISTGRADQYYKWLGGQYFVLDGGDGQAGPARELYDPDPRQPAVPLHQVRPRPQPSGGSPRDVSQLLRKQLRQQRRRSPDHAPRAASGPDGLRARGRPDATRRRPDRRREPAVDARRKVT